MINFVTAKFKITMVELVKIYFIIYFAIISFAVGKKKALPSKKFEGCTSPAAWLSLLKDENPYTYKLGIIPICFIKEDVN